MGSIKSFRKKTRMAKKIKQNRPLPNWIRYRTDNTIRYNARRRHWRRTKLKFWARWRTNAARHATPYRRAFSIYLYTKLGGAFDSNRLLRSYPGLRSRLLASMTCLIEAKDHHLSPSLFTNCSYLTQLKSYSFIARFLREATLSRVCSLFTLFALFFSM